MADIPDFVLGPPLPHDQQRRAARTVENRFSDTQTIARFLIALGLADADENEQVRSVGGWYSRPASAKPNRFRLVDFDRQAGW